MDLPQQLYTREQSQQIDRYAIEVHQQQDLMERAGRAAWKELQQHWPEAEVCAVVCGKGNNAGDGYVLARLAHLAGLQVQVYSLVDCAALEGDAKQAYEAARADGVVISQKDAWQDPELLIDADVVVDAILGTGCDSEVTGTFADAIRLINNTDCDVLALDLPSGLDADTGMILGEAIEALLTVTFIVAKQGCFIQHGPDYCGEVVLAHLDIPDAVMLPFTPSIDIISDDYAYSQLTVRPNLSHKGDFGHVLIVGGDQGFGGAARMAGMAALRAGAGCVTVAAHPSEAHHINTFCPELMQLAIDSNTDFQEVLKQASTLVIGPGLTERDWSHWVWQEVLAQADLPMVIDAGALRVLASTDGAQALPSSGDYILTPHPGEAAALLATTKEMIQSDRQHAVSALVEQYGGVAVLKGSGTLIKAEGSAETALCALGNPGMSTAGMGDVLTGVIAGLLAQGLSVEDAAKTGVYMHAAAGDEAAAAGERGLVATDLLPCIRGQVNRLGPILV